MSRSMDLFVLYPDKMNMVQSTILHLSEEVLYHHKCEVD